MNQNLQGFIVGHHDLLHGSCLFCKIQSIFFDRFVLFTKKRIFQKLASLGIKLYMLFFAIVSLAFWILGLSTFVHILTNFGFLRCKIFILHFYITVGIPVCPNKLPEINHNHTCKKFNYTGIWFLFVPFLRI